MTISHDAPPGGWPVPRSAYVHVPFCRHRCGYCNFSVIAGRDDLADDFLVAIEHELSLLQSPRSVDTLFIGGGTPTHLSMSQLERLFDSIDRWLPRTSECETSIEANPEDICAEKLSLLAERHVNRVSLGVQSFRRDKLTVLQRSHDRESASNAIRLCAEAIGNVSVDLIFAAPGETPSQWHDDLLHALSLPIDHLSTYALTFEKGTSFWNQRLKGILHHADEEDELAMYLDAIRSADGGGLTHYEISNFARDGRRCRHNLAYWEGRGWFAFGPGAASFVNGYRNVNHRSTTTYLRKMAGGQSAVAQSEPISMEQYASERAAFGVRLIDGIDLQLIRDETGVDVAALRAQGLTRCHELGLIEYDKGICRLTRHGTVMADSVATAFLG